MSSSKSIIPPISRFNDSRFSSLVFVLAFGAVQVAGFLLFVVLEHPTLYAFFALISVGTLAYSTRRGWFAVAASLLATSLLLVLVVPLAMLVVRQDVSVLVEKATDPEVHRVLYLSVYAPLIAAVTSIVFGVPLAYVLSRGFRGQSIVETLVDLPLVVPHSVAGIAILFGFGKGGLFPQASPLLTLYGAVLAMVFVSAPYAVNSARQGFDSVDSSVEKAARSLGADEWETFKRVEFPIASKSVLVGGLLAWSRSVSEFGAIAIVAYSVNFFYPPSGGNVEAQHAPVYVFSTYSNEGLQASGAVAILVLTVSAGAFIIFRYLVTQTSGRGGVFP